MLSHVSLGVRDFAASALFYDAALGALGYVRLWTGEKGLGYGSLGGGEKLNLFVVADANPPGPGFHLAFTAPSVDAVDMFYAAALTAGGQDLGPPGPRVRIMAQPTTPPLSAILMGTSWRRCTSEAFAAGWVIIPVKSVSLPCLCGDHHLYRTCV